MLLDVIGFDAAETQSAPTSRWDMGGEVFRLGDPMKPEKARRHKFILESGTRAAHLAGLARMEPDTALPNRPGESEDTALRRIDTPSH